MYGCYVCRPGEMAGGKRTACGVVLCRTVYIFIYVYIDVHLYMYIANVMSLMAGFERSDCSLQLGCG